MSQKGDDIGAASASFPPPTIGGGQSTVPSTPDSSASLAAPSLSQLQLQQQQQPSHHHTSSAGSVHYFHGVRDHSQATHSRLLRPPHPTDGLLDAPPPVDRFATPKTSLLASPLSGATSSVGAAGGGVGNNNAFPGVLPMLSLGASVMINNNSNKQHLEDGGNSSVPSSARSTNSHHHLHNSANNNNNNTVPLFTRSSSNNVAPSNPPSNYYSAHASPNMGPSAPLEGPLDDEETLADMALLQTIGSEETAGNLPLRECVINLFKAIFSCYFAFAIWMILDLMEMLFLSYGLGSEDAFAGVATAITVTTLTATSISMGFSSALDSMIPEESGKNELNTKTGRLLAISIVVNIVAFVPFYVLYVSFPLEFVQGVFPRASDEMYTCLLTWLSYSGTLILPQLITCSLQKYCICQRRNEITFRVAIIAMITLPMFLVAAMIYTSRVTVSHVITSSSGAVVVVHQHMPIHMKVEWYVFALATERWIVLAIMWAAVLQDRLLYHNLGNGWWWKVVGRGMWARVRRALRKVASMWNGFSTSSVSLKMMKTIPRQWTKRRGGNGNDDNVDHVPINHHSEHTSLLGGAGNSTYTRQSGHHQHGRFNSFDASSISESGSCFGDGGGGGGRSTNNNYYGRPPPVPRASSYFSFLPRFIRKTPIDTPFSTSPVDNELVPIPSYSTNFLGNYGTLAASENTTTSSNINNDNVGDGEDGSTASGGFGAMGDSQFSLTATNNSSSVRASSNTNRHFSPTTAHSHNITKNGGGDDGGEDDNDGGTGMCDDVDYGDGEEEDLVFPRFYEFKEYIAVGLPSLISFGFDIWALELMTILAARCGSIHVAAWSLLIQTTNPIFAAAIATSVSSSVFIGGARGRGVVGLARTYSQATVIVAFAIGVLCASLLYFVWPYALALFGTLREVHGHTLAEPPNAMSNLFDNELVVGGFEAGKGVSSDMSKTHARFLLSQLLLPPLITNNISIVNDSTTYFNSPTPPPPPPENGEEMLAQLRRSLVEIDMQQSIVLFALFQIPDVMFYSLQGVLRGHFRQVRMTVHVFVSMWLVAVPLASVLTSAPLPSLVLSSTTGSLSDGVSGVILQYLPIPYDNKKYHRGQHQMGDSNDDRHITRNGRISEDDDEDYKKERKTTTTTETESPASQNELDEEKSTTTQKKKSKKLEKQGEEGRGSTGSIVKVAGSATHKVLSAFAGNSTIFTHFSHNHQYLLLNRPVVCEGKVDRSNKSSTSSAVIPIEIPRHLLHPRRSTTTTTVTTTTTTSTSRSSSSSVAPLVQQPFEVISTVAAQYCLHDSSCIRSIIAALIVGTAVGALTMIVDLRFVCREL